MSNYLDKLGHVQVVINCRYSVAQLCTRKDALANNLDTPYIDDIMSFNLLTTIEIHITYSHQLSTVYLFAIISLRLTWELIKNRLYSVFLTSNKCSYYT